MLQKGRCVRHPFQVAALTFSMCFPIPEPSHVLQTPGLLVTAALSLVWLHPYSNFLSRFQLAGEDV